MTSTADLKAPDIQHFAGATDAGEGARARLGLLVLESDQTIEPEFSRLLHLPGVSIYHARLANDPIVTPETLAKMAVEIPKAAALIPPFMGIKALAYACTSGSTIIGEAKVASILHAIHPDVPSTTPIGAVKAALTALGAKRIALLTPYSPSVTAAMQGLLQDSGFSISAIGTFNQEDDAVVGKISPDSVLEAALALGRDPAVEAVFISCTNLRTASIIAQAETALGKPVTSSNHALAWHMLRLAGINDKIGGQGRLFACDLQTGSVAA